MYVGWVSQNPDNHTHISNVLIEESMHRLVKEFTEKALNGVPTAIEIQAARRDGKTIDLLYPGSPIAKGRIGGLGPLVVRNGRVPEYDSHPG